MVGAAIQGGGNLCFEDGALLVPTDGDEATVVVLNVTPKCKHRACLAVPKIKFGERQVENPNRTTAFPPGSRQVLPALMFFSTVNLKKLSSADVDNFVGAGNMLVLDAEWHIERTPPPQPRVTFRGSTPATTTPNLACFEANHVVPTRVYTARDDVDLQHLVSMTIRIPVKRAHDTLTQHQEKRKRLVAEAIDGVVPMVAHG